MRKLYCVSHRRRLAAGNQKVTVFLHLVVEESAENAIAVAKSDGDPDVVSTGSWSAYKVEGGLYNVGCYIDEATPAERNERRARSMNLRTR